MFKYGYIFMVFLALYPINSSSIDVEFESPSLRHTDSEENSALLNERKATSTQTNRTMSDSNLGSKPHTGQTATSTNNVGNSNDSYLERSVDMNESVATTTKIDEPSNVSLFVDKPQLIEAPLSAKKGSDGITRWTSNDNGVTKTLTQSKSGDVTSSWTSPDGRTKTTNIQSKTGNSVETSVTNNFDGTTTSIRTSKNSDGSLKDEIITDKQGNAKIKETIINADKSYRVITYDPTGRSVPKSKYYDTQGKLIEVDPTLTTIIDAIKKETPDQLSANHDPNKSYFSEDIREEELKITRDVLDSMAAKLDINTNNVSATMFKDVPTEDINERYEALKNYDKNNRTLIHSKLNEFKNIKNFDDARQTQFTQDFIDQQLGSFGKDQNSHENIFKLPEKMQKDLTENLKKISDGLKETTNPIEISNILSKMSDEIMNTISDGRPTYTTEFDANGNYIAKTSTTLSDGSNLVMSSKFDNDGLPVNRELQVGDVKFTTDFKNGWFYGKSKGDITVTKNGEELTKLSSAEGDVLSYAWMQHKANQMLATTVKLTGWMGKQMAISTVASVFAVPIVVKGVIGVCTLASIKGISMLPQGESMTGYQFTGYDSSRPVVWTSVHKMIKATVGDEGQSLFTSQITGGKPLMSGKSDTILRSSSEDTSSSIDNTYLNPIVDGVKTLFNIVSAPAKALFPQTLGDTMFSSTDMSTAPNKDTTTVSSSLKNYFN